MVGRLAIAVLAGLMASCGASATASPSSSASQATTAQSSPSSAPTASASNASARQAATAGVIQLAARLNETYVAATSCPLTGHPCIYGQGDETDGVHAAYFNYGAGSGSSNGPGPHGCYVYVYEDGSGWHFLGGYCTQNLVLAVGGVNDVKTPGTCANLRDSPGLSSKVIRCLPDATQVEIDRGPTWLDGHLWWHVTAGGWLAHENLLAH